MSLLGHIAREVREWTQFGIEKNFFGDWGGTSTATYSGVSVSQKTAMTCSAVYASVSLISETIATLPVDVVQRYPNGARYARPKPQWMLTPNVYTGLDWIGFAQQTMTSLLLVVNAFCCIVRIPGSLTPDSLWPLDPATVVVAQDAKSGRVSYTVGGKDVKAEDMLHVRGIAMPGSLRGLSPIEQARQSLGRTFAAEKYASKMFANMATPGVVISTDKDIENAEARDIARRWDDAHAGTDNVFRTAVFGSGAKVSTIAMSPEQVQMIETMRYGILDVARWYRIPPYMLDPSVSSTWGSGIAEQNIQTKQYTLNPWAVRLQEAVGRLIYDTYADPSYAMRFDFRAFLKGDPEKQARYLETKMRCRAMTPNEWRALDDENPLPNGNDTLESVQWQGPDADKPSQEDTPNA